MDVYEHGLLAPLRSAPFFVEAVRGPACVGKPALSVSMSGTCLSLNGPGQVILEATRSSATVIHWTVA